MADINKLNQIVQQAKAQGKTSDEIKSAIQKIPGLLPTNQKQPQKSTQVPSQQYTPQQVAMQESIAKIPQGQYLDQRSTDSQSQTQTYTPQQIKMQEAVSRIPSGQYLDQGLSTSVSTQSQYTPQQIKMQEAISKIPQGQYLDQGIPRTQQTPPVQQPAVQEQEAQAFETAMSLPNTENDILMQLQTNNNPTNDKSVNYGGAMQRYTAYNTFSNMQPSQIAQAMSSGQLIQGSKEWNDLMNSPNAPKLQEAISLQSFMLKQQVNNNFLDTMNVDTSKSLSKQQRKIETTPDLEMAITQKIMQTMTDPSMAIGLSETIKNDQQIQLARGEANKTKEQIDGVQQSIVNLEDDLKAQIIAQGGVPTQGYLAALVAERSKPLIRQLEALNMTYSNQMGSLQMMTEEATARYESQQNARMMQVEALKFGLGQVQRQGDIQREQQMQELQYQREIEAENRQFQRQTQLQKLGFSQDMAKMQAQQDFELERIRNDYSYQNLGNGKVLKTSSDGREQIIDTNQALQEQQIQQQYQQQQQQVQQALQRFTQTKQVGQTGGQCGKFVNDYLQSLGQGRLFTDPISAKKMIANSSTPTVGSIAIFDYTNNPNASNAQQKYGHVAIVESINADGTLNLLESNRGGDEKVFRRNNVDPSRIHGYYDPAGTKVIGQNRDGSPIFEETSISKQETSQSSQIKLSELAPALQGRVLGITDDFDTRVNNRFRPRQESYSFVNNFDLNTKNPSDDQALIYSFAKFQDPESVVREGEYNTVAKYSQSLASQLGFDAQRMIQGTQILTPDARKYLIDTIKSQYNTYLQSYKQQKNQYAGLIEELVGSTGGDKFLIDVTKFDAPTTQQQPKSQNPLAQALLQYLQSTGNK